MSGFTAVGVFLASLFFSLLLFTLWLRIALRYFRMSMLNPLSQLVRTLTDPFVNPIQSLLKQSPVQQYDTAAFVALIILEFLKIIILSLLAFHALLPLGYLILYVLADLIIQPCDLLFFAILIRVIMSFINPAWQGPIADFLRILTEPLLSWGRKIIPVIAGFDFSPLLILLVLKMITLFIS